MIIKFKGLDTGDTVCIKVKDDSIKEWIKAYSEAEFRLCEEVEEVEMK